MEVSELNKKIIQIEESIRENKRVLEQQQEVEYEVNSFIRKRLDDIAYRSQANNDLQSLENLSFLSRIIQKDNRNYLSDLDANYQIQDDKLKQQIIDYEDQITIQKRKERDNE